MNGGLFALTLLLGGCGCSAPALLHASGGAIEVVTGTAALAAACNNRFECQYRIDRVAEWRCAGSPEIRRVVVGADAGGGALVTLVCARPDYTR
jgi:hypothetical protein